MKQLFILLAVLCFFWACSGPKKVVEVEEPKPDSKMDSIAYAMETFDGKFKSWYQLHKSPDTYRSQEFYEKWNRKYVKEWNHKAYQKEKSDFFVPIMGYDRTQDYGFQMNHQLFYYFQYVENVLKIEILPNGPKVVTD